MNGWLSSGIDPTKIYVLEPHPSEWLLSLTLKGLNLNITPKNKPEVCVIAVKPTKINEVLTSDYFKYDDKMLFISIAAGTKLQTLNELLNGEIPIMRVMPNTPATVRKGISCLISNEHTTEIQLRLAENLFSVVGETIRLSNEAQMDAVTAISGSGPSYVFYLIEVMARVGIELGLDNDLAQKLALMTVSGSGSLATESTLEVNQLRKNVTSPNGTTEAALHHLMDPKTGLLPLMRKTVFAACEKSKNLGS